MQAPGKNVQNQQALTTHYVCIYLLSRDKISQVDGHPHARVSVALHLHDESRDASVGRASLCGILASRVL